MLSQALLSLDTVIQQSGAAVTSDQLPTAVANEAMLMHLFQNLIGNSIKYKGDAAPAIHYFRFENCRRLAVLGEEITASALTRRTLSSYSACSSACTARKFPARALGLHFAAR